jgi:hypothetical protein
MDDCRGMHRVADRPPFVAACARAVEREAFLVLVLAMLLVFLLRATPYQLVADTWLALVAGREVVEHGLPERDTLTIWTHGVEWIDQQWLGQLVLYGVTAFGGIKLALLANVGIVASSFGAAAVAARRLGGSARSVAFTALPCVFAAFWAYQLRAQTLAYPLFVAVLWLLVVDCRRPSPRVLLVLPLLVLWGNIHGSAVLGALLVAIRGATPLLARWRARPEPSGSSGRALVLAGAAPLCLLASPYGLSILNYYGSILLNPDVSRLVVEWGPSAPSAITAVFFVLAFATVWLTARHGTRLTLFEQAALFVTMAGGFLALRNIVWFALTALVMLPALVDAAFPVREPSKRRLSFLLAGAAAVGVVAASADAARLPPSWYSQNLPPAAANAVAAAAADDAGLSVFATEPFADWLLWERPELAGRVAFDVRFELFSPADFRRVVDLYEMRPNWREGLRGHRLVVLESSKETLRRALLAEDGTRVLYRDADLTVLLRKEGS